MERALSFFAFVVCIIQSLQTYCLSSRPGIGHWPYLFLICVDLVKGCSVVEMLYHGGYIVEALGMLAYSGLAFVTFFYSLHYFFLKPLSVCVFLSVCFSVSVSLLDKVSHRPSWPRTQEFSLPLPLNCWY